MAQDQQSATKKTLPAKAAAQDKAAAANSLPPPNDPDKTIFGYLQKRAFVLNDVAGKMIPAERMIKLVLLQVRKNPKLGDCDPASVFNAVLELQRLGLEPGGAMGQAALVPYGPECNAQVMFQGMCELAYRSGLVKDINTKVVHVGDFFDWQEGDNGYIVHKPSLEPGRENRPWTHVYCIITTTNGGTIRDVMDQQAVFRIRAMSKDFAAKGANSVWAKHELPMSRKTVLLRTVKTAPKSAEMRQAIDLDRSDYLDTTSRVVSETPRASPDDAIMAAALQKLGAPTVKETLEEMKPKEPAVAQEGPPGEEPPPIGETEELDPAKDGQKL